MIEEIIKELQNLLNIKEELENLKIDKKKMADKLLEYELKEFEKTSIADRKEKYFSEWCIHCRYNCNDKRRLPNDIGKPEKSEFDFFPGQKCCKDFEWD